MSFDIEPGFEHVQRHHDLLMELGRLELMAEEIRTNHADNTQSELLVPIENDLRQVSAALSALPA